MHLPLYATAKRCWKRCHANARNGDALGQLSKGDSSVDSARAGGRLHCRHAHCRTRRHAHCRSPTPRLDSVATSSAFPLVFPSWASLAFPFVFPSSISSLTPPPRSARSPRAATPTCGKTRSWLLTMSSWTAWLFSRVMVKSFELTSQSENSPSLTRSVPSNDLERERENDGRSVRERERERKERERVPTQTRTNDDHTSRGTVYIHGDYRGA